MAHYNQQRSRFPILAILAVVGFVILLCYAFETMRQASGLLSESAVNALGDLDRMTNRPHNPRNF